MTDKPSNVLLLLSDEHRPDALGCADHPHVETPTLDSLADHGTRFTNAYCPSPLCAPCRAAFSTGQYVHEGGAWDNAASYDGEQPTWGEHFTDHGVSVTTVGTLDFQRACRASRSNSCLPTAPPRIQMAFSAIHLSFVTAPGSGSRRPDPPMNALDTSTLTGRGPIEPLSGLERTPTKTNGCSQ